MKFFGVWAVALSILVEVACAGGGSALPGPFGGNQPTTQLTATATPTPAPSIKPSPVPSPTPTPSTSAPAVPMIASCQVFPANNPWNTDISAYPVDPNSANYLAHMNASTKHLHPDFGSNATYGIPYITVPGTQPRVPISFTYASESDPGPYPFPSNAPIEGGSG